MDRPYSETEVVEFFLCKFFSTYQVTFLPYIIYKNSRKTYIMSYTIWYPQYLF